jgi:hypothetical protein
MGSGKTAVLAEASDLLGARHVIHAAIDLDALGLALLPGSVPVDDAMYENLRLVAANYSARGVERFLVARAMESREWVEHCIGAVGCGEATVCRLTARMEEMKRRVAAREPGLLREELTARVARLNDILDRARLENFAVTNENRSLTDVAMEVLIKAGWLNG